MKKILSVLVASLFITSAYAYQLSSHISDGNYICELQNIKGVIGGKHFNETIPMQERSNNQVRLTITNNRNIAYFDGATLYFDGARNVRHNYSEHGWYTAMPGGFIGIIHPSAWGSYEMFTTLYVKHGNEYIRGNLKCRR